MPKPTCCQSSSVGPRGAVPVLLLTCCLLCCTPPKNDVPGPATAAPDTTKKTAPPTVPDPLEALFDQYWSSRCETDPLFATQVGDHRFNDRLPAVGPADFAKREARARRLLQQLEQLDDPTPNEARRLNKSILEWKLKDELAGYRYRTHLMPISAQHGFHMAFPQLPQEIPLNTVADFDNYIARLSGFKRYTEQHIELMRAGLKSGHTQPRSVLGAHVPALNSQIVTDPKKSVLYRPFETFPHSVPQDRREALAQLGVQAIAESVIPGFEQFKTFLSEEYLPGARETIGASALPDGRAFYEQRVRRFTTTELTPEQIHQKGLAEVERIRAEMLQIIDDVGFKGDFKAFVTFLRTDPRFYVNTAEELLKETALVLKKMDGRLPELFATLPRTPYGIKVIPDYIAPRSTTAYYDDPPGDGTRAGQYFVNTYNLKSRPLYEIDALSFHEAVPGHHLQIALQQELKDLPPFRRFSGFVAFIEGWALYAERLGLEVGFYQDPYRNFGRLTFEMWRACRLVVDTGLHTMDWPRKRAIEYMAQNTALSLHNIRTEVDRYISWPGQALAYKIGELKIRELRKRAEQELGTRFDIRQFHDVVLLQGSLPLTQLEKNVTQWIKSVSN